MQGVTVFARAKKLKGFEGKDVGNLTEIDCRGLAKPLKKSILEASSNYKVIMGGGQVVEPSSPLQKLSSLITPKKIKFHN